MCEDHKSYEIVINKLSEKCETLKKIIDLPCLFGESHSWTLGKEVCRLLKKSDYHFDETCKQLQSDYLIWEKFFQMCRTKIPREVLFSLSGEYVLYPLLSESSDDELLERYFGWKDDSWECIDEWCRKVLRNVKSYVKYKSLYNPLEFKYSSRRLLNDLPFILSIVGHKWEVLRYASEEVRGSKKVIREAMMTNVLALQYASAEIRSDKIFLLSIFNSVGKEEARKALKYVDASIRNDEDIKVATGTASYGALLTIFVTIGCAVASVVIYFQFFGRKVPKSGRSNNGRSVNTVPTEIEKHIMIKPVKLEPSVASREVEDSFEENNLGLSVQDFRPIVRTIPHFEEVSEPSSSDTTSGTIKRREISTPTTDRLLPEGMDETVERKREVVKKRKKVENTNMENPPSKKKLKRKRVGLGDGDRKNKRAKVSHDSSAK